LRNKPLDLSSSTRNTDIINYNRKKTSEYWGQIHVDNT
jgi:hypothetical protein